MSYNTGRFLFSCFKYVNIYIFVQKTRKTNILIFLSKFVLIWELLDICMGEHLGNDYGVVMWGIVGCFYTTDHLSYTSNHNLLACLYRCHGPRKSPRLPRGCMHNAVQIQRFRLFLLKKWQRLHRFLLKKVKQRFSPFLLKKWQRLHRFLLKKVKQRFSRILFINRQRFGRLLWIKRHRGHRSPLKTRGHRFPVLRGHRFPFTKEHRTLKSRGHRFLWWRICRFFWQRFDRFLLKKW